MDKITRQRIAKLHPKVREEVTKIINQCDESLNGRAKIRITQGLRTFEEQELLYARGRLTKERKVTNAKAGQSIHNYGLAVDICLIIDGKEASFDTKKDWDGDQIADWYECVKIFAKNGWDWGGNWVKFKDLPHFERRYLPVSKNFTKVSWRNLIKMKRDILGYVIF